MSYSWRKLINQINDTCSNFDHVYVMVSGGVDSMFLANFMLKSYPNINIVHFQHHIRDNDDQEVELVSKFAKDNNLPFFLGHGENLKNVTNQEFAASNQRWAFVESLLSARPGKSVVITAHHLNDNIEQFFMSSIRGRSVDSLIMKSMVEFKERGYWRYKPLLEITKQQIIDQCEYRNIAWIDDHTNYELDHERNIFRNSIIPQMNEIRNLEVSMLSLLTELANNSESNQ